MMAGIEKMKESLSHFFECLALLLELTQIDMLDSYQWPWEFTPKCFNLAVVNQRKKTETVSQEGECILLHAARMQTEWPQRASMAEPKPSEKVSSLMKSKAVAHNPTGVDPTPDQWQKIVAACKERILESKVCLPCICFMVALLSHQPDYSFLRY